MLRKINGDRVRSAFTIMEIMVVVVIVSVLSALAIPNYVKTLERARLRDAMTQMQVIHAAEQIYAARNGGAYWPNSGAQAVAAINTALGLNIIEDGMAYSCTGNSAAFSCTATRTGGAYTVTVVQTPIAAGNPVCTGTCP